jgi:drug/metabolite transporter (DMT)-like permease
MFAFAAVYLFWGSTYLAIRIAIETLPPFLMAATRHLIAGAVLYVWARRHGLPRPGPESWKSAVIAGALLLVGGNGAVVWAEKRVASGLAALLVATVPLWIAVLNWIRPGGARPGARTETGLVFGFAGMALLVDPSHLAGHGSVDLPGAALLVFGSLSWSVGSLYAIRARPSASPLMGSGMQMLSGGTLLLLAGLLTGEAKALATTAVSWRSVGALGYLVVFGSLAGFTSYIWLLRATTPARASTYAFVNPVVAVLLGWGFAGEAVTLRTIAAAAVIIAGVVIITTARSVPPPTSSKGGTGPESGGGGVAGE